MTIFTSVDMLQQIMDDVIMLYNMFLCLYEFFFNDFYNIVGFVTSCSGTSFNMR